MTKRKDVTLKTMVIADLSNKRASGWRLKSFGRWSYLDFWLRSVSVKGNGKSEFWGRVIYGNYCAQWCSVSMIGWRWADRSELGYLETDIYIRDIKQDFLRDCYKYVLSYKMVKLLSLKRVSAILCYITLRTIFEIIYSSCYTVLYVV